MSHPGLFLELLFERDAVPAGASVLHGAVRLEAAKGDGHRKPLDLVACIDVSGSMGGDKIRQAKASLVRLSEQLTSSDTLGIVSFSDRAGVVLPPAPMGPDGREAVANAVASLSAGGGTHLSAGLRDSLGLLDGGDGDPRRLRRVLLFTDGHANRGLTEDQLDAWAALLRERGAGRSVSWFGYGEDHDAGFLAALAALSNGNCYRAADADAILDGFAKEIGGLLSVMAQDVRVVLAPGRGVALARVLNDFTATNTGEGTAVVLPDISAEERRYVVFELRLGGEGFPGAGEAARLLDVDVRWTVAASSRAEGSTLGGTLPVLGSVAPGRPDTEVQEQVALLRVAQAQREAERLCDAGEFAQARRLVFEAAEAVRDVGTERAGQLAALLEQAAERYGSEHSYHSSRSYLFSLHTSLTRMRASGSAVDDFYSTPGQAGSVKAFRDGATTPGAKRKR